MADATAVLRVAHLYPGHMNLYGDRGNVLCLEARARWRGIAVTVDSVDIDDRFDPEGYDIVFVGGGPDREQQRIARDLTGPKAGPIRRAVEGGVVFLAVCGGYQLFGHYYRLAEGEDLPGLGIFDMGTEHPGIEARRCIGNLAARCNVPLRGSPLPEAVPEALEGLEGNASSTSSPARRETLVGFENHGGRTYLAPGCTPLAQVIAGSGNNGADGTEGAVYKNAFGTYLHGSFLPKNPRFADHLVALALERQGVEAGLPPLDDRVEERAHRAAMALATRLRT